MASTYWYTSVYAWFTRGLRVGRLCSIAVPPKDTPRASAKWGRTRSQSVFIIGRRARTAPRAPRAAAPPSARTCRRWKDRENRVAAKWPRKGSEMAKERQNAKDRQRTGSGRPRKRRISERPRKGRVARRVVGQVEILPGVEVGPIIAPVVVQLRRHRLSPYRFELVAVPRLPLRPPKLLVAYAVPHRAEVSGRHLCVVRGDQGSLMLR